MSNIKQIQVIPSQIDRPSSTGNGTVRGTYTNLPYNKNLLSRLHAIMDKEFTGDLNMFDDENLAVPNREYLEQLLSQVVIRFDNDPNYYTKRDYYYLIWYLCQNLVYLHENSNLSELEDDIKQLAARVDLIDPQLVSILERIAGIEQNQAGIPELLKTIESKLQSIEEELASKQDILSAGSGIHIVEDTISATTTEDIKVSNVRIGRYTEDQVIEKGTDIMEILRNILSKVIKMSPSSPSASYQIYPAQAKEYGSNIDITEEIKFTQGLYKADDDNIEIKDISMDCRMTNVSGSGWTINGNTAVRKQNITLVKTETYPKETITVTFSEDTVGQNNTRSDIEITPYTGTSVVAKGSYSISPYFNAYIGYMYVDSQWSDEQRKEELLKVAKSDLESIGQLLGNTLTINKEFKSESPKFGMILACPTTYQLSEVVDFSNIPCTPSFTKITATKSISCANDIEHSYDLYLNDATSSYVQIKSVTFKKR